MNKKNDNRIKKKFATNEKRTDRVKKAERERMQRLRAQGKTIEEIALELDRSERTVSNQLQKTLQAVLLSVQDNSSKEHALTEELRVHDREIFKKSDEILNEDRLDKLINRLLVGNRYYFEEIVMLFRYASFFEKESYNYVILNLRQQCVRCCKMIDRLSHFIEIHSYYLDVDDDELGMKFKLIAGGDYDRFYNNLIDGQIQKVERIFSNKADRIARECRDAYKEYRSTIRETLYL